MMTGDTETPPRVIIRYELFMVAVAEAAPEGEARPLIRVRQAGSPHSAVGFQATLAEYGLFILAARGCFGPTDAALLAAIAQQRDSDGHDGALLVFYFPGLELY